MRKDITKEIITDVCNRSISMAAAAAELNIHFNTFKRIALKFGCYKPNQGLKGGDRKVEPKILLEEILDGKHPQFQTYKLKNRLILEGILENKCSVCNLTSWMELPLNMELDHIDGNRTNHRRENLRMICPNCHAQTETYRSKNKNGFKEQVNKRIIRV